MSTNDPLPVGVVGRRLDDPAGDPTKVTIHTGSLATRDNLASARLQFPEASREDFEKVGKRWRDKSSGVLYGQAKGAVLLSLGDATRAITCFFVDGDEIIFVERLDVQKETSVGLTGPLRAGRVGPDGQVIWEGTGP